MTRIAWLDASATGIAGDMAVGALLDLGFPIEEIASGVERLGIGGLAVRAEKVTRGGLAATKYVVDAPGEQGHRGIAEIAGLLEGAKLAPGALAIARDAFDRLARAEAKRHAIAIEKVHFHEVGAADALADVVGFAIAWAALGFEEAFASPLPLTRGTVSAAHGSLPVPAPATLALLEGYAWEPSPLEGELVTPTGAALLAAVTRPAAALPPFTLRRTGYGAGTKELPGRPNLFRLVEGERAPAAGTDRAALLEANLDDMNPQLFGPLADKLREAGALDVWQTPVQMKKGRPGTVLSVLGDESAIDVLAAIVFRESSTIGIRIARVERRVLPREIVRVDTRFGALRVKVAQLAGRVVNAQPEFEDVAAAASKAGVPVKDVLAAATAAAETLKEPGS